VKRGVWILSRVLGEPPAPPPSTISRIEPDIRGATTMREQLEKHRSDPSCNSCHKDIDPPGFALESFDVMGGWRDRYRAMGSGDPVKGSGHNGILYHFCLAKPVDSSGEFPDGERFADVQGLKKCLLKDEELLARNLAEQFTVYATGAPIRFSDRAKISKMLADTRSEGYGVRSLVHEVVESELFLNK
jgi:hypothetical protein